MKSIFKKYKLLIIILLCLILLGGLFGYRLFVSYGYVSNTSLIRRVIKNMAGFYYDRGGYIQYDNTYMDSDKLVSRWEFFLPEDANRDSIKYVNEMSFIENVFKNGINLELKNIIGEVSINNLYKFGNDIYLNNKEDVERNNIKFDDGYVIDYYDNKVVTLSGSMTPISDHHYLIMYVDNKRILEEEKNKIFGKLKETLYVGDILLFDDKVMLYVGNDIFMYADGDNYNYQEMVEYKEDRGIKTVKIDDLINAEYKMFSYDNFYVFRFLNIQGYWRVLPKNYDAYNAYYRDLEITPLIKIEKYANRENYQDVSVGEEIQIIIKIINGSNNDIVVPSISDTIGSDVEYISNNYADGCYNDGKLLFTDIKIEGNAYKEISYKVKVKEGAKSVLFGNTKIGEYYLNTIKYNVTKKLDLTKIINGDGNRLSLYEKVYGISIDINNIPRDSVISNLFGGLKNSDISKTRWINKKLLSSGDLIIDDKNIYMYVNNDSDSYLVNMDNEKINIDIDKYLFSLFGNKKFMIIRPSYLYNSNNIVPSEWMILDNLGLLVVNKAANYEVITGKLDKEVIIKDSNNLELNSNDIVKSGDKVLIENKEYMVSLLGDMNGDGVINTGDVLKLHRMVLEKIKVEEAWFLKAGEVTDDEDINTGDVLKLHRYILGKVDSLR